MNYLSIIFNIITIVIYIIANLIYMIENMPKDLNLLKKLYKTNSKSQDNNENYLKFFIDIFKFNKKYNVIIFIGIIIMTIGLFNFFSKNYLNLDLSLIGFIILIIGLVELCIYYYKNKSVFIIIISEAILFILVYTLEFILKDMKSDTFNFEFFLSVFLFLVLGLIIIVMYTFKLNHFKFFGVIMVLIYSLFLFFIFYIYVGYGFVILEFKTKDIDKLIFNVKDFNENAWNESLTLIYYGISKAMNFNDINIGNKNDIEQNIRIGYIQLSLISYLFNLIYFSVLINIFSEILKKEDK